jgi:hypothetical protein
MGMGYFLSFKTPSLEVISLDLCLKVISFLKIRMGKLLQHLCRGHRTRTSIPALFNAKGRLPTTSPRPPVLANGLISGLTKSTFMKME